jgi:hypothetical protein
MRRGSLLFSGERQSIHSASGGLLVAIVSSFLGTMFLLAALGVISVDDSEGNRIELGTMGRVFFLSLSILCLIWGSYTVKCLMELRNPIQVFENGILFPGRSLDEAMRGDKRFLPFDEIEEIFLNEPPVATPFIARNRKGYHNGKRKAQYQKIAERLSGRLPHILILQKNGKARWMLKEEIGNLNRLAEVLKGRVDLNQHEYFFVW